MESTAAINPAQNQLLSSVEADLKNSHEYIYSIDFSMLINKLIKRHKWLKIEAEEVCKQYRNYLWLLKKYGTKKPLPPSEDIDEFWHHHLLDSTKYLNDCNVIFGHYIHHYPYYGNDSITTQKDLDGAFLETLKCYQNEFGASLEKVRLGNITRLSVKILNFVGGIKASVIGK